MIHLFADSAWGEIDDIEEYNVHVDNETWCLVPHMKIKEGYRCPCVASFFHNGVILML